MLVNNCINVNAITSKSVYGFKQCNFATVDWKFEFYEFKKNLKIHEFLRILKCHRILKINSLWWVYSTKLENSLDLQTYKQN